MKHIYSVFCGLLMLGFMVQSSSFAQQAQVSENVRFNASEPIRDIAPRVNPQESIAPYAIPNKNLKFGSGKNVGFDTILGADPVRQVVPGIMAPQLFANFDGSNDDDNAALLGFRIVPPDTDGDVGPNHYLQWINLVSEIFDKSGNTIMGPFPGNQYFSGLTGSICESTNDGDPIVLYDELADRWLVSQFAVPGPTYSMCIAISQTPDPTGGYNQYEFSFGTDFADYPKLGIWGDSYIMTTRDFANGQTFAGISAVALDRTAMINGQPTTMVRFPDAFNIGDGAIPADFDGPGAAGLPAIFGAHGADGDTEFELWELDVDWSNPGAATFNSIPGVTISAYDGNVPSANQPNGQVLDDLSGFTMFRLNARDFGTHISMVTNHTVEASSGTAGVRWYEFRNTGGGANWTLHQEGTYSPDSDDRWMGSIAINTAGDIALGYSRSSSSLNPSIYFTGQTAAGSGTGQMNIAETAIIVGGGSQEGASRWGDYSMMSVDPTNDTFWFTTEYYAATGSFDFNTRIANFELGVVTPATSVAVSNLTTGTSPAPQGKDFASATVTVLNDQGFPVSGYTVTGDFSGTITEPGVSAVTNSSGIATIVSSGSSRSKNFTVEFCVSDVAGPLPYNSNNNASPSYACTTGGGDPTEVVVASITTGSQGIGGGNKIGTATVTLEDDLGGNPGVGYTVTGDFSGDINESGVTAVTNSSGVAELQTIGTARGNVNISFCVSNVSGGSLPYNGGNTCTSSAPNTASNDTQRDSKILDVPETFSLDQNYPNPFNPTTIMSYALPESGHVSIKVYNLLGQEMATVIEGFQDAGHYDVAFNASHLSAGVYLYVMQSGEFSETRRMTLLK